MSLTRTCPACGYTHSYPTMAHAEVHHPRHSCQRQQLRNAVAARRAQQASARITRDCRHPGTPHTHGSRVAYVKDQCRCRECTTANTTASGRAKRAQVLGRWSPYVDAEPARNHIQMLRTDGIGYAQIAKLADTSVSHVREIAGTTGRTGHRAPIRRIRQSTAQRLLAIRPSHANRAARSRIDATGTRRRLQALISIGWTHVSLAEQTGRSVTNLKRSMGERTVTVRTEQAINDLYARLWDVLPPQATPAQRTAAGSARVYARERGWLAPLAWDDIDADPEPTNRDTRSDPDDLDDLDDLDEIAIERASNGDTRVRLTHAEKLEAVRRMSDRGYSVRTIAELLSTSMRTISRHRRDVNAA